jgi:hypothetical protein
VLPVTMPEVGRSVTSASTPAPVISVKPSD